MDFQSSFSIIALIGSSIILIVVLVALFYKPPRKFKVVADFESADQGDKGNLIKFTIKNIGKKDGQILTAFVKCMSNNNSIIFDLRDKVEGCRMPVSLKIGEKADFDVPWVKLEKILESKSFASIQFRIIIENSVGMEFESKTIDLPAAL